MDQNYFRLGCWIRLLKITTVSVFLVWGLGACTGGQQQMEEPIETEEQGQMDELADQLDEFSDQQEALGESLDQELAQDDAGYDDESLLDSGDDVVAEAQEEQADPLGYASEDELPELGEEDTLQQVVDENVEDDSLVETSEPEAVPAPAVAEEEPVITDMASGEATYVVQPGDTLASISTAIYGTKSRWQEIAQSNGVSDPNLIFPGDELRFRVDSDNAQNIASKLETLPQSEVTVKPGDTLESIARVVYGPNGSWRLLMVYNKQKISNPNLIKAGMVLNYVPIELVQSAGIQHDSDVRGH